MPSATPPQSILEPECRLLMLVGAYGSGKTEVAVNLAIRLARAGRRLQIADLDLVNPYFRSREARALMEQEGIRVVVPPGSQAFADLPIVLPEIRGMLHPPEGTLTLFDVGGDDVGARVLSSLQPALGDGAYELWQVINGNRPFTATPEGCHAMRAAVESAARLRVTGLVANTHLIDDTTPETILGGWRLVEQVARESGVPVRCVAALESFLGSPLLAEIPAPLLGLERMMLPPWRSPSRAIHPAVEEQDGLPAARPVPIGKPPTMDATGLRGDDHGSHRD